MIFGIYGHLKRLYYIYLAVPVNDVQPIWNKICINLQKRMLSPRVPRSYSDILSCMLKSTFEPSGTLVLWGE